MKKNNVATFGAGCFWHVQHAFDQLQGVTETEVGFAGGEKAEVTYEEVCAGGTGHTEVCKVVFDPEMISYKNLVEAFWEMHDPTTENRQGPDIGYQYRSVIFFHDETQKMIAEESLKEHQSTLEKKIVTAIEPIANYCAAEEYHQKYFEKTGKKVCGI